MEEILEFRFEECSLSKKKVALITGITGQDGSYLAELLLKKGYEVHGIKRRASTFNTQRLDNLTSLSSSELGQLKLHYGDVTDSANVIRLISEIYPDEIYNLAAQSHVQVSFDVPEYTAEVTAVGALRVLEAIQILKMENVKFYQASTSEMFGLSEKISLNEESKFRPRSPYAVAKLYAHWITVNYREAYGMFASNGILFNHESPRRGETFVTRKIVRGALRVCYGIDKVLELGNLEAERDWGHAKDFVEGMWKILQFEKADDWVLATGYSLSVRQFAERVFEKIGSPIRWEGHGLDEKGFINSKNPVVQINQRFFRPTEVPYLNGDASKAKALLGWDPKIKLDELIDELIEYETKTITSAK
jgi:GDPmannose 4,6-dehydratase